VVDLPNFKVPLHVPTAQQLVSGRTVAPGETFNLTAKEIEENQELIDQGMLMKAEGRG